MFLELGSLLLLITGQQTASQGHGQCTVAEQRVFFPQAVRLSGRGREGEREAGQKEKEGTTVCCRHRGIDRRSVNGHGVNPGF